MLPGPYLASRQCGMHILTSLRRCSAAKLLTKDEARQMAVSFAQFSLTQIKDIQAEYRPETRLVPRPRWSAECALCILEVCIELTSARCFTGEGARPISPAGCCGKRISPS